MQHEEEWLVLRTGLEKFQAQIRGDAGAVPLDVQLGSRHEEHRILIGSLAGQHDPAVESGRVGSEVPLADHAGVIAPRLEPFGHVIARAIEPVEDGHAVQVGILARKQGGPAGRADGIGDKGMGETGALLREAVDVGSLIDLGSVGGDGVLGVVVGEDKKDIRRRGGGWQEAAETRGQYQE